MIACPNGHTARIQLVYELSTMVAAVRIIVEGVEQPTSDPNTQSGHYRCLDCWAQWDDVLPLPPVEDKSHE